MTNDASNGDCGNPPSFGSEGDDGDLHSIDALFDSLASHRSRRVLSYLESASVDVVELDELVARIVECEMEEGRVDDPDDHRRSVAITLHHNYLPKLSEAALLDYDARSKTVRYWNDGRVAAVLELTESAD